jgi:hypothetical protein
MQPYRHIRDTDLCTVSDFSLEEQLTILRRRIQDFEFRVKELTPDIWKANNTDARLILSLQAQIQDDRKKLRELTGEL